MPADVQTDTFIWHKSTSNVCCHTGFRCDIAGPSLLTIETPMPADVRLTGFMQHQRAHPHLHLPARVASACEAVLQPAQTDNAYLEWLSKQEGASAERTWQTYARAGSTCCTDVAANVASTRRLSWNPSGHRVCSCCWHMYGFSSPPQCV